MSDDPDSPPEREMKDFQFRQLKKIRVFDSPPDLPKDRSNLLAVSNKFGLIFVGLDRTLKVYVTHEILSVDKVDGNTDDKIEVTQARGEVCLEHPLHHVALSSDEVTLSVCSLSAEGALSITFYDVRTLLNQGKQQKLPFAALQPAITSGTFVQDLKWNPALGPMVAICLSDGSMMVLDVTDRVTMQAQLPASTGITCICWSPKGKQVAVGKMNATVSQYTPALQEKKVVPCPNFYTSDNPVKVLDVLWLRTFVFAVVYAAADGSVETPPDLVVITLPKKDEKIETRYLNFNDPVYGTCIERQHHYFLSQIEDWDVVFATSAASIEVSVIAKDKNQWELWILEDASRADLPVSQESEDTLPLGLALDYTSQQEIHITDEKKLPPAPIMLLLSTDGVLCPFSLLNFNPGAKSMVAAPTALPLEGERPPLAGYGFSPAPKPAAPFSTPATFNPPVPSAPGGFPALRPISSAAPTPAPPVSSAPPPFSAAGPPAAPGSGVSSGFSFALPSSMTSAGAPPAFSLGSTAAFGALPSSSSSGAAPPPLAFFPSKPLGSQPAASSAFAFSTPSAKAGGLLPPGEASPMGLALSAQRLTAASPLTVFNAPEVATPAVKINLNDRFSAVETPTPSSQAFSFTPALGKPAGAEPAGLAGPPALSSKGPVMPALVRPVQTSTPTDPVQKPSPAVQSTPQAPLGVKALEKQLQQKRGSDPIMTGILDEIAHFQKELGDLKARSMKADFTVGTAAAMKALKKETEDLHVFTLEIQETTESLHGDIGTLKTTLLEGFTGAADATAQTEISKDRGYLQLLYKKPLDPRSEERLKEIRRLYQYVMLAVEDVNDVLDMEWEMHLEKKKKQKHMLVPGREALFTTLSNNLFIINQQKSRLDQLVKELSSLHLYTKPTAWTAAPTVAGSSPSQTSSPASLDRELESLRDALLKAKLDTTSPKASSKTPASKLSPVKRSQLRNFLSKRQMPHVRSTAPANLSRSAFLSPKYYEDLDDVSSTSSLSQSMEAHLDTHPSYLEPRLAHPEPHPAHLELEDELELGEQPLPLPVISMPRHPTVVRTTSIQPGFGGLQSTPAPKMVAGALSMGVALSPIVCPVPTNKMMLVGADSTALATKTVKHGAPPAVPVTMPAQQAAATAALRRQMANQKPVGASLTESTLKTVPQVVNVQELKDKGSTMPLSAVMGSSLSAQANQQAFATVASQAKRNPSQGVFKVPADSSSSGFVFGPKTDPPAVLPGASEPGSKLFSFTPGSSSFSFASVSQGAGSTGKDGSKFAFSSTKGVFGSGAEEPFSFASKSSSPALGLSISSSTPPPNVSGDPARPSSATPALRVVEPQAPGPAAGGETLGIFSGLRVGQGEEDGGGGGGGGGGPGVKFAFGEATSAAQFSFGLPGGAPPPDAQKGPVTVSPGSVFKPPEASAKLGFSAAQPSADTAALPASLSSLLTTAPLDPPEGTGPPAASPPAQPEPPQPSGPSDPPPSLEPPPPAAPSVEPPVSAAPALPPTPIVAVADPSPAPPAYFTPASTAAPTSEVGFAPPAQTPAQAPPMEEPQPPGTGPNPTVSSAPLEPVPQVAPPPAYQAPSAKPGSVFAQPAPAVTTASTIPGIAPIINTVAPETTPTATTTVANPAAAAAASTTAGATVFGQPAADSSAPPPAPAPAPAPTGFGSNAFGAPTTTGFGTSLFGQGTGFNQPAAANAGAASPGSFSFGSSAFGTGGPGPNAATGGAAAPAPAGVGGGLFGAPTATNASSFSFGSGPSGAAPGGGAGGAGLFGQSAAPAFGQPSPGFGQAPVFGSNTTTTASTGFSFSQPSAFGSSSSSPSVFGQQPGVGTSVFGQPSGGGGLFGSGSAGTPGGGGASGGGGFFSGLGGKPSEDAANKNPFGAASVPSPGGFGQPAQPAGTGLFGSSGTKTFGFGQTSFGEQKASGTFSAGAGSVASQGFGSFASPTKPGGFGSAPVFGSPPSFGGSPAFGGGAAFGSAPAFSNATMGSAMGAQMGAPMGAQMGASMGSTAGKVFGEGTAASNVGGFGFASPQSTPSFGALANQSAPPTFGGLAQQTPGFGAQQATFGVLGQQPQGGFSGGSFTSPNQSPSQTFASWRS